MAKRSASQRIADIYTNIEAARRYVDGVLWERFKPTTRNSKPFSTASKTRPKPPRV
jgi:hypothetical protein